MMNDHDVPINLGNTQPQPQPEAEELKSPSSSKAKPEPSKHSKPCTLCSQPRDGLIRCQIDSTKKWNFICPGKCWKEVSGGTPDGDERHPLYRYGGMWKNKHEYVSAKIKGVAKRENRERVGGMKGSHGGKGREKRFKSEKDLPGVKGRGGVVEGVDDGVFNEQIDEDVQDELEESLRNEELDEDVLEELQESLKDEELDEGVLEELQEGLRDEELDEDVLEELQKGLRDEELDEDVLEELQEGLRDEELDESVKEELQESLRDEELDQGVKGE